MKDAHQDSGKAWLIKAKLNLIELYPIFDTAPAASTDTFCINSGQKWHEFHHFGLLVKYVWNLVVRDKF